MTSQTQFLGWHGTCLQQNRAGRRLCMCWIPQRGGMRRSSSMEVCSGLGDFTHHCGESLQLEEVTRKWPAGQADLGFPRQEKRAGAASLLCAVPKGGGQERKAHAQHVRPARSVSTRVSVPDSDGDVQQCWVRSRDRQNHLILLAVLGQLFYFFWIEGSLCQILGDQQHHAKPSAAAWLATSVTTSLVSIPPPRSLLQTRAWTT